MIFFSIYDADAYEIHIYTQIYRIYIFIKDIGVNSFRPIGESSGDTNYKKFPEKLHRFVIYYVFLIIV